MAMGTRHGVRPRGFGYDPVMTAFEDRRAGRDRDWTDSESEGQPATEDQPPGIDAENAVEGTPLPADHPVASNEIGVTEVEELVPETLRERVARERPDAPQAPDPNPGGRLAVGATDPDDDPAAGEWAADAAGLSAEEAAVHIEEDLADET